MTRRMQRITLALVSLTGLLMAQGCPGLLPSRSGTGTTFTPPQPGLSPPTDPPANTGDRAPVPGDLVAISLLDVQTNLVKSRIATGKTGSSRECVNISLALGEIDPALVNLFITLVDAASNISGATAPLFETDQPNVIAPAEHGTVTYDAATGVGQYCPPNFVNQELLITVTAFGLPTNGSSFPVGTASFVVAPPGGTLSISLASQFPAIAAPNSTALVTDPSPAPGVTLNETSQRITSQLTAEVQGGTPSIASSGPYTVEFFANDQSLGQVAATIELNAQNQIVAVARKSVTSVENPADENLSADLPRLGPGAKTLRAVVTDSSAVPATATSVVSLTVNSPLSVVGSAIPNGGLVTLSAVATGGLAPYTFLWSDPFNGDLPASDVEKAQSIVTLTPANTGVPSTAVVTVTDNAGNKLALRPPPNQLTCPLPTIQTGLVDILTPTDPAEFVLVGQNSPSGGPITFVWEYSATAIDSGFSPLAHGDRGGRVSIVQVADTSTLTITGVLPEDDGFYRVSLSDNCGSALNSSVARLAGTSPTVQTIVRHNPLTQLTSDPSVVYRVTFSENVNNVDAGDFTLIDVSNAISGETISSVSEVDAKTYDVTVNTGDGGTGDLRLDVLAATATIEDETGNVLGVDFTTGEVYTIDHDAPTVTSIVRQNPAGQLTNLAQVDYRVTFSEDVFNVDTADFTLTDVSNALTGESIVAVNGVDARTYDVRVNTGSAGTGDLRLDVIAAGSTIEDTVGNALGANFTAGQVYTVDHDAPTVVSINRQTPPGQATNLNAVTWRVTFSENVNNVDIADFIVFQVSGAFFFPPFVTSVSSASGTTIDVTANTGLLLFGNGEIRLDVQGAATITDDATNALTGGFNTGQTYSIDVTAPTVTSINRQNPAGQNTNAGSVTWRVSFSENVTNVSTADFTLVDVSNAITGESITSVSAASGMSIDVTVNTGTAGTGDLRLDVIVPGASISDDAGNALALSFTTGQVYTVDHDNPAVLSIVRLNPLGQSTNAASVIYRVTFSENVNNVAANDFTLVDVSSAITGESVDSVSAATGTVIDVTVNTGSAGTGDLRLDVLAATATIDDDQANPVTADFTTGQVYSIDLDDPVVLSINRQTPSGQTTNAASVIWRVTFNENVNGVAIADFTLVDVSNAITGESITSVSAASGTTIDVTVNTGSAGTGDLRLDVTVPPATLSDDIGNTLSADFTSGQVYTVDHDAPTVVSIDRETPSGQLTNAASVVWRVTFSENVNNVAPGDFTLVDVSTVLTGESVTSVSAATGTVIDVTADSGTAGTGDLRLDVIALSATITDDGGNSLTLDFTTGEVYTIDHDAPTVVSVATFPADRNSLQITFSEAMAGSSGMGGSGVFDEANYTITGAGIDDLEANPNTVSLSSGNIYDLDWDASDDADPGGAFTLTVSNVTDLAGNPINPAANSGAGNFP